MTEGVIHPGATLIRGICLQPEKVATRDKPKNWKTDIH